MQPPALPQVGGGASRPDSIRRHNLGLLLTHVHRDGPLTRAELTARLGLNRSTTGVLVAELEGLGVLAESVPEPGDRTARAGRPSHLVGPHPDGPYAVAVEVDVDRCTVAAVRLGGHLTHRSVTRLPASPSAAAVARVVARCVERTTAAMPGCTHPVAVGVSIPGTVQEADGLVEAAPNLGWRRAPLGRLLAAELPPSLPVVLGNDADLCVLAEHLRGAARDTGDVILLLGKVGVGAGILVDGRPLRGATGLAGEIGHTRLDPGGAPCHCGGNGCVEVQIGQGALLRLAGRPGVADDEAVAALLADARGGELDAVTAVSQVAGSLGAVVADLVTLLNPRVVVLGGVLSEVAALALPQVSAELHRQPLTAAREVVEIRRSALGADSALIGAAELAFREFLTDPSGVLAR